MPTVLAAAAHALGDEACQLLLYTGFLFWSLAYLFIIVQCYIQKTYGVPWQSICLNLTWEFFFAFVCPAWTPLQQAAYCSGSKGPTLLLLQIWFALDVVILCQLLCYGRREQRGVLRRYFAIIIPLCLFLAFAGQMTFVTYNTDNNGLELSWIINLVMSLLFVEMALSRRDLRGLSYPAAWLKMAGTLAMAVCVTRLGIFFPKQGDALLVFLATATLVADWLYIYLLTVRRTALLERRLESRHRR